MSFRRKVSIGSQIMVLPLASLIGFSVVLLLLYLGVTTQSRQSEVLTQQMHYLNHIQAIQHDLTNARTHEKRFLGSSDPAHILPFDKAIDKALTEIRLVTPEVSNSGQLQQLAAWEQSIHEYQDAFHEMQQELEIAGYTENTGVRGVMREAAHGVETQLKGEDPNLQVLLLELRRREKESLLRDHSRSLTQWEKALSGLKTQVAASQLVDRKKTIISDSLNLYARKFRNLKEIIAEVQKDTKDVERDSLALTDELSGEVLDLQKAAANEISQGAEKTYRNFRIIVVLTALTAALVFMFGRWIGNGIRRPMARLSTRMARLAQGDLGVKFPVGTYTNEIGTMTESVDAFRENAVARLRSEHQLRDANTKTQGVFRAMEEAVFEFSPDGTIVMTNPAAEKLLGLESSDLIGQKLTKFFSDRDNYADESQIAMIKHELETLYRDDANAVETFVKNAPTPAMLVSSGGLVEVASKASAEVLGYAQSDMTGLNIKALMPEQARHGHDKHLQRTGHANSGRMMSQGRTLTAVTRDGTEINVAIGLVPVTLDNETHFVCFLRHEDHTAEFTDLTGTKFGQLFADIDAGIDMEHGFQKLVGQASNKQTHSVDMVRADGGLVPVQYTVSQLRDEDDQVTGAICVVRDVTEQIASETKIRQFKKVLDLSQDEIHMFRADTLELLYMNHSARASSGWMHEQYQGKTLMDGGCSFNLEEFRARAKPLHDGTKQQVIYRKDCENEPPVEVALQLIRLDNGEERYISFTRDITERLAAEKAKTEFISTISHELRTPLTAIKGFLGIIQVGALGPMTDKAKELTSVALDNSNRLERIIGDILDTEKIASGQMKYSFEPVDLGELVEKALSANERYANVHNVQFVANEIDKSARISGDPDRLMQIMANLLSNAAKFSDAGGTIEVSLTQSDSKVRLSVKDHGCGIPEEAQSTIFERFTQADSSDKRSKGGTGLGLSIVRTMVQAHGGEIDFKSAAGQGTEFVITFEPLKVAA